MKHLLTFGLLTLSYAAVPAGASTFTLGPIPSTPAGSTFDVALTLADAFAGHTGDFITSLGFDIGVDNPLVAGFTGFTAGPLFFDATFPGSPDVFVIPNDPAGLSPASTGYTDPFTVAVLHFNALSGGTTTIHVTTDTADDLNQGLYYASVGTALDFSASAGAQVTTATPEPATLGFAGLGLSGMALAFSWITLKR